MSQYTPNTTQTLDIVYDRLMCRLSGSEFKVLCFLIRQTYGFGRPGASVGYSVSQICDGLAVKGVKVCEGTGLSNRVVIAAVKALSFYGLIEVEKGSFKDAVSNRYRLCFLDKKFDLEKVVLKIDKVVYAKKSLVASSDEKSSVPVTKSHREGGFSDDEKSLSRDTLRRHTVEKQGETREIIHFQKLIFTRLLPAFKNTLRVTDEMNLNRVVRSDLISKNLDVLSERLIDEFFTFRKKHGGVKLEHFNGRYNDFDTFCANFRLKGGTKTTDDDDFFAYASEVEREAAL